MPEREQILILIDFLQCAYLGAFWVLLEKKGFRLNWFAPLAAGIVLATFFTIWLCTGQWLPQSEDARSALGPALFAAGALVVIYPIHAGLTVWASRLFKLDEMTFLKRQVWRGLIVFTVIPLTGCLVILVVLVLSMPFRMIDYLLR